MLSQETEGRLLEIVRPFVHPTFVDVGAEKGGFSRLLASQGLRGVCLEPLPKHSASLEALATELSVIYLPFAADAEDGCASFHVACNEHGEPLDYFHSLQPLLGDSRVHHQQKIEVKCRSLGSLHAEGIIDVTPGIVKIDTEGNDLRVLRGLGPVRPEVLMCEFFTPGVYAGWEEAAPDGLIKLARELGYEWWLAVRRKGTVEVVTLCPTAFGREEWGNLIFISAPVFESAREALGRLMLEAEHQTFAHLKSLAEPRRGWLRRLIRF
jgi:FkbM family methyltransferase